DDVAASEWNELARRDRAYRGGRSAPDVRNRTVIIVDDGLATGATMRAAAAALKACGCSKVVVAVPVAAASGCEQFRSEVDDIVCLETPEPFYAVGLWYEDFSQTSDEEVRELLALAEERRHPHAVTHA